MTSVDLELCWGEERLACSSHAVDAVLTPGGPFPTMRPLAPDGDAFVLFVPPRARGWLLTANGWRDLSTLRVLGCLAPDPACPGGARIRLRLLRDARGMEDGVVLVRRVDAWLEIEGWWLRVSLGDDVAAPPRTNRRALGRAGAARRTGTARATISALEGGRGDGRLHRGGRAVRRRVDVVLGLPRRCRAGLRRGPDGRQPQPRRREPVEIELGVTGLDGRERGQHPAEAGEGEGREEQPSA
ncbi:MAG: hypothetical protein RLP09_28430, partial [Sandaracinaceae bacterium]